MQIFGKGRGSAAIRLVLVGTLALATGCSPALAQQAWRCSAENGRYVENPRRISPRISTLSGRIQFNRGDFSGTWNPVAHIAFTDGRLPQNGDCFCNGIRAEIFPNDPNTVKFFMIFNGNESGIAQADIGKPITFRLSIDNQGEMTAVIGKTNPIAQTASLAHARRDTVQMSCSSGDVTFLNLQTG